MNGSILLPVLLVSAGMWGALPATAAELDGALVAAVFDGSGAIYAPAAPGLSASARACRSAYLRALPQPLSRDAGETLRHPKRLLAARRDYVARQAQVLAGLRDTADARRFAQSLTLHVEWEGMSEPPLREASEALRWAQENPASPVAAAARLFAAHRLRAAEECALRDGDAATAASAAAAWRDAVAAARAAELPLIHCLADDLARVAHVYVAAPR